jgi:periplasmic protein TonB
MGADTSAQPAGSANAVRTRAVAVIDTRDRRFFVGLALAALVHALALVGFLRAPPRQMGETSGQANGISVELVEAADLKSKNTFADEGAQPGAAAKPAPKQPPPQAAAEPEPPAPAPKQPPQQDKSPPADPAPPAAEPLQVAPRPADKLKANPWVADVEAPNKVSPPAAANAAKRGDQSAKTAPAKKQLPAEQLTPPQPKPPQKLALKLDLPPQVFAPGARGAAVVRPPGVTRSGENDEFGRGVIRALRKTMPSSAVLGRVTVRFLLSQTGNLIEVHLMAGAGDPSLDQNVVFAVKQASFPIPPQGATVIDRTFQVTYVYH